MTSLPPMVGPNSVLAFTKQYISQKTFREQINLNHHFNVNMTAVLRSVSTLAQQATSDAIARVAI